MSADLLEAVVELMTVQDGSSLHRRILDLVAREPGTGRCALFVDEFGALGHVAGSPDVPHDGAEDDPTWRGSWRLVPLNTGDRRQGLLVYERPDLSPAPGEALASHAGHALAAASNYALLEDLVNQEMATAVAREQSIQLILDNMNEGLLVVGLDGRATEVRSAAVSQWLGPIPDDQAVWGWLAGEDGELATRLEHHFEQIAADFLPFEVAASQMPDRVTRGPRTYTLRYTQVFEDGALARVLITIEDVTAALEAERQQEARREMEQVVRCVLSNIQGFRDGLTEMQRLLEHLPEAHGPTRARLLHTIKGNGAILGFSRFASEIHDVETMLLERGAEWGPNLMERIRDEWSSAFDFVRPLVAEDDSCVQIHVREYQRLLDGIEGGKSCSTLRDEVTSWTAPSIGGAFARFARSAERLATAGDKQVDVVISGEEVRIRTEGQRAVVSAIAHVVRNAMEHGIETVDERTAHGKPPAATLRLSAEQREDRVVVVVEDDGRGIDVDAVRALGARRGLPPDADLFRCLCAGSTRSQVSLVSGRGLGMGALEDAIEVVGGQVTVETWPGRGTRFVIEAPRQGSPTRRELVAT